MIDDANAQITDRALMELYRRLEPFIKAALRSAPGGWRFNLDNEGGWGYLQFNDTVDIDALPDPMSFGSTWGGAIEDASGDGLAIGSTTNLWLRSRDTLLISALGDISVRIELAGHTFTVLDGANNPIFTLTG